MALEIVVAWWGLNFFIAYKQLSRLPVDVDVMAVWLRVIGGDDGFGPAHVSD
jgi:hypothetical protein